MTSHIVFSNKGKKWSDEQDQLLKQQYQIDQMNIIDIAKQNLRTVGSIICRLKNLEVLSPYLQTEDYNSVRGYSEYLKDTEFMEAEKESRKKKDKYSPSLLHPNRDVEITEIKRDITEIKKGMNEILSFLHSIYEEE